MQTVKNEQMFFTTRELALRLNVSLPTLRSWIETGGIPHIKIKRRIRVPVTEYLLWERQHINGR
jgi:excisionase family DNA binding protein